jgi:hypothetical protein
MSTSAILLAMAITAITITSILVILPSLGMGLGANAQVQSSPVVACVTFTKDGSTVGERICNPDGANDMHVAFRGKCSIQFTTDGENVGNPISCPHGINDFTLKWDTVNGVISQFTWSKNGNSRGTETVPADANDCHFEAKKIVVFQWTKDGNKLGDTIPAPAGADDFECDIVKLPT